MARRVSLPAADDLFRPTDASDAGRDGARSPARRRDAVPDGAEPGGPSKPSGRVRHDEKMTVYVTSDELLDIEHARLALRRCARPGRRPRPAGARGDRTWCSPTSRPTATTAPWSDD